MLVGGCSQAVAFQSEWPCIIVIVLLLLHLYCSTSTAPVLRLSLCLALWIQLPATPGWQLNRVYAVPENAMCEGVMNAMCAGVMYAMCAGVMHAMCDVRHV